MTLNLETSIPILLLVLAIAGREVLWASGRLPRATRADRVTLAAVGVLTVGALVGVVDHVRSGLVGPAPIDLAAVVEDIDWPAPSGPLPPTAYEDLVPIMAPIVESLGYHLSRAQLFGDHLAVYIAPLEEQTGDQYAAAIVPLTRAFLPAIFDLWPGITSFDLCQEPLWVGRYDEAPPLVTIIDLNREQVASVDWDVVTLSDLITAARNDPTFRLGVNEAVAASSVWSDAGGSDDLIDVPLAHDIARYGLDGRLLDG
jgi:hypothetical protein